MEKAFLILSVLVLAFFGLMQMGLETCLLLTLVFYRTFIKLTGTPIDLFYILSFLVILCSFSRKVRASASPGRSPSFTKYVYGFILVIFFTAGFRGFGLRVLGGDQWGGIVYIQLLILLILMLRARFLSLNAARWKPALFGMLVAPFLIAVPGWIYFMGWGGGALTGEGFRDPLTANPVLATWADGDFGVARYSFGNIAGVFLCLLAFLLSYGKKRRSFLVFLVFLLGIVAIGFSGHRLGIITVLLFSVIFFILERQKRKVVSIVITAIILLTALVFFGSLIQRLPPAFQRAVSWIPFAETSSLAKETATASSEWRIEMWKTALPDVPRYFWIGRGYTFSGRELDGTSGNGYEEVMLVSNYHNGPLDVMIGLGVFGIIFLLGILFTAFRRHWRFSRMEWENGELKFYHRIISAFFGARILIFLFIFGGAKGDLPMLLFLIVILEAIRNSDSKISHA